MLSNHHTPLFRLRSLQPPAQLYLLHAALLTFGLAINVLFFNIAIPALGHSLRLLGLLNSLPTLMAGVLSLPLWWLVTRVIGLRTALLLSALCNATAILTVAIVPATIPLLVGMTLTGPAAVLLQVSAAPFMMRHSADSERDALFSLNAGINIGFAGLGSLVGGALPGLSARLLDVAPQSGAAYRATFALAGLCVLASVVPLLFISSDQRRTPEETRTRRRADANIEARTNPLPALQRCSAAAPQRLVTRLIKPVPEPWQSMLQRPWSVLRFMVTPLLISCGAAILIPYLNLFFRQRFGASDEALGVIFASISVATGLATLAAPWLSARLGKMGSVALTQALAVPCLLALGAAPVLGIAVAFALVRGSLMNMASPLYDAYAMEQNAEDARPTVIGLINGAFGIGYIFGPAVSVLVQEQYGFAPLFYATAGFYTLAATLNYVLFVRGKRRTPAFAAEKELPMAQD